MKNLDKRKILAAKVLGAGKNSVVFDSSRLAEIKEAITKQDIRDLFAEGIIMLRAQKGRKQKKARTTKRGPGKIKLKVRTPKRDYLMLVRKLRKYTGELRKQAKITEDKYQSLRIKIKSGLFRDKSHLKEYIGAKS